MSAGDDNDDAGGRDRGESYASPGAKSQRSKGKSTDSSGGRGRQDDDQNDEFVDEPNSPEAAAAQATIDEIEAGIEEEGQPEATQQDVEQALEDGVEPEGETPTDESGSVSSLDNFDEFELTEDEGARSGDEDDAELDGLQAESGSETSDPDLGISTDSSAQDSTFSDTDDGSRLITSGLNPSENAAEQRPLDTIDPNHGNSMSAKEVVVLENGKQVVQTDLDHPSITREEGERQMVGAVWTESIAPDLALDHSADFEEGWYANEVAPGVDAADAKEAGYADEIDDDTFTDMAAVQVLIGNTDAHQNNVRVDEDGNLYPFDLDRAAGDVDGDWVGNMSHYDDTLDRMLGELEKTATALDVEMDREVVLDRAGEIAQKHRGMSTPAEAIDINSELSDTVRNNIESLAQRADENRITEESSNLPSQYSPDEVPEQRRGSEFEDFTSREIVNSAVSVVQQSNPSTRNWTEWQSFFDSLDDAELEEAAVRAFKQEIEQNGKVGFGTTSDFSPEMFSPSTSDPAPNASNSAIAGLITRLGRGDPYQQRASAERIINAAPDDHKADAAASMAVWAPSADVRREIYEEYGGLIDESSYADRVFELQFADDIQTRKRAFCRSYVGSTKNTASQVSRTSLGRYQQNADSDVSRFNKSCPAEHIEPTEEFEEAVDVMSLETGQHIENEYDGSITLYRGVRKQVAASAPAESWTTDFKTAQDKFDGHAVLEAEFELGEVVASHATHAEEGYSVFEDEEEYTVLGGALMEQVPDDMRVDEYFETDSNSM